MKGCFIMDNIIEKINLLKDSPIRKYLREVSGATIFDEEKNVLTEIDNIIDAGKGNLQNPLKVVILGEVKAGKSTLINSLIGKKVSFTDVNEATTTIIEIKYAENEKITVVKEDAKDNIQFNSLEDLHAFINKSRKQQDSLNKVKKIEVYTSKDRLKEITIVDTPGLNTITKENADRTENYIAQSDVILWVLNSNHLGQSDVTAKIEEVMDYGKPIICVANRIDEIQGNPLKVKNYINEEMGYMFKAIFTTSAKLAWDGVVTNDDELINSSSIKDLYDYLVTNIEKDSKKVQIESVITSINTQISRDYQFHTNAKKRLEKLTEILDNDINELKRTSQAIKEIINSRLNQWLEFEFFSNEKKLLLECKDADSFQGLFTQYCNNTYLNQIVIAKNDELSDYLYDEWGRNTVEKINKINAGIVPLGVGGTTAINHIRSNGEDTSGAEIIDSAVKAGTKAGGVGLAASAGLAMLPSIALGPAIMAICPPLLIAGAIGGALKKFMENKKKKDTFNHQIQLTTDKLMLDIRNRLKADILPKMKTNLYDLSDKYYEISEKKILSVLEQYNISESKIKEIIKDLTRYIQHSSSTGDYVCEPDTGYVDVEVLCEDKSLSSVPPNLF